MDVATTVAVNYYVENNERFEGFCRLWFSSRPTYLSFRIHLLAMFQNTEANKDELLVDASYLPLPVVRLCSQVDLSDVSAR